MHEKPHSQTIQALEQRLAALDRERNEIVTQINKLKSSQNDLSPLEKIILFRSLFRGREDVYARRWESKAGKSGYSPHCANEWKNKVCQKPQMKCSACKQKAYVPLSDDVFKAHLRSETIIGLYPLTDAEKCYFLAIDFYEAEWVKDIGVLRDICQEAKIPIAVERSRSGMGAHVWIFFEVAVSASLARKLGSALLTHAMNKRHEITFKSYDRLFPNQDTLPKGGLGNLIALPLQAIPKKSDNSVFIDEYFSPYEDQWKFLREINKLSESGIQSLINRLCTGNELGELKADTEESPKPWIHTIPRLSIPGDIPAKVEIVKANLLYIKKEGFSQKALNQIKRLAAFKNPEFYKAQAMRMPTFNKPRIISCCEESEGYMALPRGACRISLIYSAA